MSIYMYDIMSRAPGGGNPLPPGGPWTLAHIYIYALICTYIKICEAYIYIYIGIYTCSNAVGHLAKFVLLLNV